MAIEYTFWNERTPELLVRFGDPVDCATLPANRDDRTRHFENSLAKTLASLADLAIARDPAMFTTLALGRAGVGGLYDFWRRTIAGLRGQKFKTRHGDETLMPSKIVNGELS